MYRTVLAGYSQAQVNRLAFIELHIRFLGEIRRQDLMNQFETQAAAATRDLALYRDVAPDNLDYDSKTKQYRYSSNFSPLFDFSVERVLTWLTKGWFVGGDFERDEPIILTDSTEPVDIIQAQTKPTDFIDLTCLSVLTRAIRQYKIVEIGYMSPTEGDRQVQFAPYALLYDGIRWCVRGFDRSCNDFVELALIRCLEVQSTDKPVKSHERPGMDIQWNRIVDLELVPHPDNVLYPEAIEQEYMMRNGVLAWRSRAALVGYLLRRWNVDCSPDHSLRGTQYHLWLRNPETLYGVTNVTFAPGYEATPKAH